MNRPILSSESDSLLQLAYSNALSYNTDDNKNSFNNCRTVIITSLYSDELRSVEAAGVLGGFLVDRCVTLSSAVAVFPRDRSRCRRANLGAIPRAT